MQVSLADGTETDIAGIRHYTNLDRRPSTRTEGPRIWCAIRRCQWGSFTPLARHVAGRVLRFPASGNPADGLLLSRHWSLGRLAAKEGMRPCMEKRTLVATEKHKTHARNRPVRNAVPLTKGFRRRYRNSARVA